MDRHRCAFILLICLPLQVLALGLGQTDVDIRLLQKMEGPDSEHFAQHNPDDPAGLILTLRGSSDIYRSKEWAQAQMRSSIFVADHVRTGKDATLKITFLDSSTLSLAGDTEVIIRDYLFGPEEAISRVSVTRGALQFMAGEISKVAPESYYIETATATVGIRGSGGFIQVEPGDGMPAIYVSTQEGHQLDVRSYTGEAVKLENSRVGVLVDASGAIMPYAFFPGQASRSLSVTEIPIQAPSVPAPKEHSSGRRPLTLTWRNSVTVKKENREKAIDALAREALESLKTSSEKALEYKSIETRGEIEMRQDNGETDREQPSSLPLMQRLAAEQRKGKKSDAPPKLTSKKLDRESSSSLPILQQLGEEIQAKQKNRNKTNQ